MSDYLWDKSGEPDAEVERLEELLGQLRHRPRAFELPPEAPGGRAPRRLQRPIYSRPAYAAAAVVALMLLAGLWLGLVLFKRQGPAPVVAGRTPATSPQRVTPEAVAPARPPSRPAVSEAGKDGAPEEVAAARPGEIERAKRRRVEEAAARRRARGATVKSVDVTFVKPARGDAPPGMRLDDSTLMKTVARVGEERRRVKEELMYALRLTGSKLNLAQRKMLGDVSPSPERPRARQDF